ncbi:hypothetical protein [Novosphingobium sp.]|uniref:hypothetical protein n=1 Tax=Novosphingobium sp. TaxID=1874826 RepID=UPI00260636BD|nr:hypothetical protein [Novosphingobium sp.]
MFKDMPTAGFGMSRHPSIRRRMTGSGRKRPYLHRVSIGQLARYETAGSVYLTDQRLIAWPTEALSKPTAEDANVPGMQGRWPLPAGGFFFWLAGGLARWIASLCSR